MKGITRKFEKSSKKIVRKASKAAKKHPEAAVIAAGSTITLAGFGGSVLARIAVGKTVRKLKKLGKQDENINQKDQHQDNTAEQKEQQEAA